MEYCLDTGDLEMVKKVADLYPIRCFSMNPSIAVNCLRGTGRTFLQNAKMIREVIGEDTPFYLEAMGDTAEEMIEDAHKIRQEIKGNTMIKITTAEYFTPSGENIHKKGIQPDVEVEYTYDAANPTSDNQLQKALDVVKSK